MTQDSMNFNLVYKPGIYRFILQILLSRVENNTETNEFLDNDIEIPVNLLNDNLTIIH